MLPRFAGLTCHELFGAIAELRIVSIARRPAGDSGHPGDRRISETRPSYFSWLIMTCHLPS